MTLPEILHVLLGAVLAFIPTVLVMSRNSERVVSGLRAINDSQEMTLGLVKDDVEMLETELMFKNGVLKTLRSDASDFAHRLLDAITENGKLNSQISRMSNEIKHLPRRAANGRMEKRS